jgi:hypothetical protein
MKVLKLVELTYVLKYCANLLFSMVTPEFPSRTPPPPHSLRLLCALSESE